MGITLLERTDTFTEDVCVCVCRIAAQQVVDALCLRTGCDISAKGDHIRQTTT